MTLIKKTTPKLTDTTELPQIDITTLTYHNLWNI